MEPYMTQRGMGGIGSRNDSTVVRRKEGLGNLASSNQASRYRGRMVQALSCTTAYGVFSRRGDAESQTDSHRMSTQQAVRGIRPWQRNLEGARRYRPTPDARESPRAGEQPPPAPSCRAMLTYQTALVQLSLLLLQRSPAHYRVENYRRAYAIVGPRCYISPAAICRPAAAAATANGAQQLSEDCHTLPISRYQTSDSLPSSLPSPCHLPRAGRRWASVRCVESTFCTGALARGPRVAAVHLCSAAVLHVRAKELVWLKATRTTWDESRRRGGKANGGIALWPPSPNLLQRARGMGCSWVGVVLE